MAIPVRHVRNGPRAGARVVSVAIAAASWSAATSARADDDAPSVTPYRPTVSAPAQLSAPGYLEFEGGWIGTQGHETGRRDSLPYSLKLAFTDDWGVRIDGEAYVSVPDGRGDRTSGFGDTTFVVKRRFAVNPASAFGVEAKVGTATARSALASGSGATDCTLVGIYSADFAGPYHVDVNVGATRLGAVDSDASRTLYQGAAAVSRSLGGGWTAVGELSRLHQPGAEGASQWLVAGSWQPERSLVIDFGVAHGMTAATPHWSMFAGFTTFGRLF